MDLMRAVLPGMVYASSALDAAKNADACVLVTEWREFLDLDWAEIKSIMARPIVIDGRNALDPVALTGMGFTYEGMGTRIRPE